MSRPRLRGPGPALVVSTVALIVALATAALVPAAYAAPAGLVWMTGSNNFGQLGDGTTTNASSFQAVPGLGLVTSVSASQTETLALLPNGTVEAWGDNHYGELGLGTADTNPHPTPAQVPGLSNEVAVSAGFDFALALRSDGTVWAWGDGAAGDIGTTTPQHSPVEVSGLSNVVAIAAGNNSSMALRSDGTVWTWGDNLFGELGQGGSDSNPHPTPAQVPGLTGVTAISSDDIHTLALLSNGTVEGWGDNSSGGLGDGTTTERNSPVSIPGLSGVSAISAGAQHSLALLSNGTLMAAGSNADGQLGDGTTTDHHTFETILGGVRAIEAEDADSLALMANGTLEGWGDNISGELGDGTTNEQNSPEQISPPSGAYAFGQGDETFSTAILQGALADLSTSSLAFGNQLVGTASGTQTVTLTNHGPAPLVVAGETLTGSGGSSFAKASDSCTGTTLPSGGTCSVALRFAPTSAGAESATLAFSSTAAQPLAPVTLTGTGFNATGAPPPVAPPPVAPSPAVSNLHVSPTKFSLAGRRVNGRCVKPTKKNNAHRRCRRPIKLQVSYTLNEAATVNFTLKRQAAGRKLNGRCVRPTKKNSRHRRCTRLIAVPGKLVLAGAGGRNHFALNGKIGGHTFGPGTYQLIAIPTGGKPRMVTFQIVP